MNLENTEIPSKTIRMSINPSKIIEILIWFVFVIGLLVKCTYFQFSTSINDKPYFSVYNSGMFVASIATTLILAAIVLLLFNKKRLLVLCITDILMTLLLLADTLYFRYYYNAITIPVLYQIGLVSSVTDSARSLFKVQDLIFAVDFPLFLGGLRLLRRFTAGKPLRLHPVKRLAAAVIVLCISFGLFQYAYGKASPDIYDYDNNYVINELGITYFHYYDIKRHVTERFFTDHNLKAQEKAEIDSYFEQKQTNDNQYRGIAKGKNLIIIQMEAIQQFVINAEFNGQAITPNLNKFINDSVYLDNFYYQVGTGNTSDAEFLVNNSLYPLRDGSVYFRNPSNTYESLPKALKKQGYASYVFHAYKPSFWNRTEMYKSVGFDRFFSSNDFIQDDIIGWGLSDQSFFSQSLPKIDPAKPFYGFFITLSSHHPFSYFEDYEGFDVGEYKGTITGNYVKAAHYLDQAIGQFLDNLKKSGLYDNSVIVIYGDHHAILKDQEDMLEDLTGFKFSEYNWVREHKTPCFIRVPGMDKTGVDSTICGQIDILPTLANLMGFDVPRAMGKDIFNTRQGYAVLRDASVITEDFTYVSSDDIVYGKDGQPLDKSRYEADIRKYQHGLEISDIIIQKNALKYYNK